MDVCRYEDATRRLDLERIKDQHELLLAKQRMDGESTQTDMRAQGTRSSTLTKLLADIEAAKHRREQDAKDNTPAPSTSHQPQHKAAATHKRVVQSSNGEYTTTSIIEQNFGGGGAAPSRVAKAVGKKIDPKKQAEETRQKEQKAQELKAQDQTKQARAKELHAANRPIAESHGASTSASKPGDRSTWIEQAATHFNWGLEQARKAFQGTSQPTLGPNNGPYPPQLSTYKERIDQTPINNGQWTGERGESRFIFDNKDIQKILPNGIAYTNGYPDFSPITLYQVTLEGFVALERKENFEQADSILAEKLNVTVKAVKNFREKYGFSWHEHENMRTLQLVPTFLHNTKKGQPDYTSAYTHIGGIGEMRKLLETYNG